MRLTFADAVFDLGMREILRRGSQVPISPKAFQLLGILIKRRRDPRLSRAAVRLSF
jgi:hypothetical protein